jgi:sn-glycerol 3-phosphate transport system substrate-binding protein
MADLSRHSITRRKLFGLGAAGASVTALGACGGGPTTGGKAKSKSSKSSGPDFSGVKPAKEIKFWSNHPAQDQAYENKVVKAFNHSQDKTTVKLVTAGSDYEEVAQKFQSALAGGDVPPTLILSDIWWFRYYMEDNIIPFDTLVDKIGIKKDDYVDSFWKDYDYKGSEWAIPYARSTPIFFYNKSHWKKAGLPDRGPKTWEEFAEWTNKLKKADLGTKSQFAYSSPNDYIEWWFQNVVWGWGGSYSDKWDLKLTSDNTLEAVEFARKSVHKDKWARVSSGDGVDDFGAQACSAVVGSTGSIQSTMKAAHKKFEFDVAFVPGGPKKTDNVCPTGGSGVGIPKKAKKEQQLAAAEFIKFLTSPKNTVGLARATGYVPVRKSADTKKLIEDIPQNKTAIEQLKHTRPQDYARVFFPGGYKVLADNLNAVLSQNKDPKSAMEKATQKLKHIYEKDVKPNL